MARVVFMGTPEFALPSLETLHAEHEVVLVVTRPDRPRGRGQLVTYSPVKELALAETLPLWQPHTLRTPEAVSRLQEAGADAFVTAAIGLLLPPEVLAIPPYGTLNVHASLLPRWRGAAPINAAIAHGDAETGVTVMQTDEGLDTGPILDQIHTPIHPDDTAGTLTLRLAQLGANLLSETLPRWLAGEIAPRPQPQEGVTIALRLNKQDGQIDWQQPAVQIERLARAYTPWPGVYTHFHGQVLKVLRPYALPGWRGRGEPGDVLLLPGDGVAVATGQGALVLHEVQMAGKRPTPATAFVRGYHDFVGSRLPG
jgi:methionyl-tRNA formyltransferase